MKKNIIYSTMLITGLTLMACEQTPNLSSTPIETQIAQKIMIDLRYYCPQAPEQGYCRTPVTQLPADLAKVISDSNIAGVILFADNLVDAEQTIKLNYDLQQAAAHSSFKSPLLISIDQEGGRVFRTSRDETIAFTGNMSIGATYTKHGSYYATETARVIGSELNALGFNVNHAPTIDVNANANNPVINVRSFGENPQIVADLGQAQVSAFQQQGIISTIKHFPGHGDTATDSHTGLPKVDHDIDTIYKMDIAPFKQIINNRAPGMIMTAHIQYPQLDSSTFVAKNGKTMVKPATMSRVMLTDILRNELNYQGVIITDALDMAGIQHFFNETDAVINTFKAGADIALMPLKIRSPKDLSKLTTLITDVATAVENGQLDRQEIYQSFQRIQKLKSDYQLSHYSTSSLTEKQQQAKKVLATPSNKILEAKLAEDAITLVAGKQNTLPILKNSRVHLIMPDQAKCLALENALKYELGAQVIITCTSAQRFNANEALAAIKQADFVLGAHIAPKQSAVEMGGMDDLMANQQQVDKITDPQAIYDLLLSAKKQQKKVIFVSLRTPYEIAQFKHVADVSFATYAYNTHINQKTQQMTSPAFSALAKVLAGKITAKGALPVSVL